MKNATPVKIILACFLILWFPLKVNAADKDDRRMESIEKQQASFETQLRALFEEYLSGQLKKKKSDIVVSHFKVTGNRPMPDGKLSFRLFQKYNADLKGYVRINALIIVDGVEKDTVKLSGWVDVFNSVVCAKRNLKRGKIIRKDDLYLARKNVSRVSSEVFSNVAEIAGLMARTNVKANACIKKWMLVKSPVVEKGDMVTIIAESGGLKVTVPGRVLERGYSGDLVRVQNSMSKRQIYAKVISNLTVKVAF